MRAGARWEVAKSDAVWRSEIRETLCVAPKREARQADVGLDERFNNCGEPVALLTGRLFPRGFDLVSLSEDVFRPVETLWMAAGPNKIVEVSALGIAD